MNRADLVVMLFGLYVGYFWLGPWALPFLKMLGV